VADRLEALLQQSWDGGFDALSPGMRAVRGLVTVIGTAENGGFVSVLWDDDDGPDGMARAVEEAVAGARLIGATDHAAVLADFRAVGPASPSGAAVRRAEERGEEIPSALEATLEALDERLSALPPIDPLLLAYADAHPDELPTVAPVRASPRRLTEAELWARCADLGSSPGAALAELVAAVRAEVPALADDPSLHALTRASVLTYLTNAGDEPVPLADIRAMVLESAKHW